MHESWPVLSIIVVLHLTLTVLVVKLAYDVTNCDAGRQTEQEIRKLGRLAEIQNEQLGVKETGGVVNEQSTLTSTPQVFNCIICQKWADQSAKHCAQCNKCVKGFDHHCLWLNNCIGTNNYKKFFALIGVYCLQGVFSLNLAISVHYMESDEMSEPGLPDGSDGSGIHSFRIALSVILIIVEVARVFCSLTLLIWHIHLRRIGITTYQFIVEQEELQKLKLKFIAKEITAEEHKLAREQVFLARQLKSVHNIKKSNIITPVKSHQIRPSASLTLEEKLAERRALKSQIQNQQRQTTDLKPLDPTTSQN